MLKAGLGFGVSGVGFRVTPKKNTASPDRPHPQPEYLHKASLNEVWIIRNRVFPKLGVPYLGTESYSLGIVLRVPYFRKPAFGCRSGAWFWAESVFSLSSSPEKA